MNSYADYFMVYFAIALMRNELYNRKIASTALQLIE